jgi:hypothetical protein
VADKRSIKTNDGLYRLNPGYDKRGYSPWHWLEADVPQELYFAFFSDTPLVSKWRPLSVRVVSERKAGSFFYLSSLFAATKPAVEVIQDLVGDKVEALPLQIKGKKAPAPSKSSKSGKQKPDEVPPLFLLHPLELADLSKDAEVERFKDGRIMLVNKWDFEPKAVAGKHFFAARGNRGDFIVSEQFRAAIEFAKLEGLGFEPLHP